MWKSKITLIAYTSPKEPSQKIHWEQILCVVYSEAAATRAV